MLPSFLGKIMLSKIPFAFSRLAQQAEITNNCFDLTLCVTGRVPSDRDALAATRSSATGRPLGFRKGGKFKNVMIAPQPPDKRRE